MSRDSSPKPDKMTLRLKRRASRIFQMNEGRKSQIVLLDDRRLDIIIQPKLYSNDLLDLVASHFKLREKQYFGLGFVDETNHFNWLQGEKRVLDHEFPKKTGLLVLHFAIRFYVDTIGLLRDTQTVELFYLNARQALFRGQVVADSETVFELAAHVMQETNGDFTTEEETREDLKKLPVIPTSTLKEHPSIAYCEDRVICHYEKLNGTSRGLAIVNYMTIIEKLPTYGIHYYDVKDKKDIPWWLGISTKGIAIYDKNDKTTPRRLFTWKNLENLYYRDKKFSIEVHGPKREETGSQVSVSRRTFGASNVDVHAWFAGTAQLTKCIWSMAVAQHQFYLDRKQSKTQLPAARSMSEIAAELCQSSTSLPGSLGSDLSRSPSSHSLPSLSNSRYDLTIEQSDSQKAERDMYQALKARKEALEEALKKKTEQLKQLCLQEGELTGELPKELPLAPGEQAPVFRRRVGTAFSLSVKNVPDTNQTTTELSKLELEVELQGKITSAAQRLASDKTVSKYVRKQRRQSYTRAVTKLKEMEKKLGEMRKAAGKPTSERHSRAYQESVRATTTSHKPSSSHHHQGQGDAEDPSHRHVLSPSHSSPQLSVAHNGNFVNRRTHGYPTSLSDRNTSDLDPAGSGSTNFHLASRLDGSHDSGFSSANNMYNVNSQRTSHYESTDQLRSPASSEPGNLSPLQSQLTHDSGQPPTERSATPHGSNLHYGSLDRKRRDFREEIYRDVSPVRYKTNRYEPGADMASPIAERGPYEERVRGYSDIRSPESVMVEVPVHHERAESLPASSSRWSEDGSDGQGREQHMGLLSPMGQFGSEHVYSPRMQESPNQRTYQDLDVSHVHSKDLRAAHHTMSQPVFLRTERSVSPQPSPGQFSSPHIQQRAIPSQPVYQRSATSPSIQSQSSYLSDGPRPIPIQRVDTSTPPTTPSSPLSQFPPTGRGSPAPSGPASPRGLTPHAASTLVTVTRLQPHTEITKPYEISDYYRYSEKLRKQRIIDQYQRQLIGQDNLSRSSSPQSVESDGHSSHASSHHSSGHHPPSHPSIAFSNSAANVKSRPPIQPYGRSASAPLSSMLPPPHPNSSHSPSPGSQFESLYPEGQVSSSSTSYTVKSHGANVHYAMQSSSYKVQHVHSSAKHAMYQPPQPMTCKPVRNPPSSSSSSGYSDNQRR